MPGNLQPLDEKFPIVGSDGRPTLYFIKWAQQRQIDIEEGITADQAVEIVAQYIAEHPITVDWGDIGGTLADQTDLQTALDGKYSPSNLIFGHGLSYDTGTHVLTAISGNGILPLVDGSVPPNLVYLDDGSLVYAEIP